MTLLRRLRTSAYGALTSPAGSRLLPLRVAKNALLYANDVVGRPLAGEDELCERDDFASQAAMKRQGKAEPAGHGTAREAAPVVVFHLDKHKSELQKITQILDDREIPYQVRNLEGDPAGITATKRDGKGYGLPVVFIAGVAVGRAEQLVNLDRSGELAVLVFGE